MSNHTGRLILMPDDPWAAPASEPTLAALRAIGLLGAPLADRPHAFAAGPEFASLILFAGCAVSLRTRPADAADRAFCHLVVPPPAPAPILRSGVNTRPPRCPRCRARLTDWRSLAADWTYPPAPAGAEPRVRCPDCGASGPPWRWDWKRQAGFGRVFVQIEEVFPGEAAPDAALFETLRATTGHSWRDCQVQDPAP